MADFDEKMFQKVRSISKENEYIQNCKPFELLLLDEESICFSDEDNDEYDDDGVVEELCFNTKDLRKQVTNTNEGVYQCIGMIVGFNGKQSYYGTGCLIGSNIVLTAAHNIFRRKLKLETQKLQFILNINGGTKKVFKVKKGYYPPEYAKNAKNIALQFDFGVLQLEDSFQKQYLVIDGGKRKTEKVKEIEICGFPGDKGKTMWTATGSFNESQNKFLEYTIATTYGQSGSPVLKCDEKGKKVIIGVHILGNVKTRKNIAVRLTFEKIEMIKQWKKKITHQNQQRKKFQSRPMTSVPSFNYQTLSHKISIEKLIDQNNDWLNRHQYECQVTKPEKPKKIKKNQIPRKQMKDIKAKNQCQMKKIKDRRARFQLQMKESQDRRANYFHKKMNEYFRDRLPSNKLHSLQKYNS